MAESFPNPHKKSQEAKVRHEPTDEERQEVRDRMHIHEFELHGAHVRFIGTVHDTRSFEFVPSFWAHEIKKADIILRETLPRADKWLEDMERDIRQKYDASPQHETEPFEDFRKRNFGSIVFSQKLEDLVYETGYTDDKTRILATADPISTDEATYRRLMGADAELWQMKGAVKTYSFSLGACLLALAGANAMRNKKVTRRGFLQLLGGLALGSVTGAMEASQSFDMPNFPSVAEMHTGESSKEQLIANMVDYRMVCAGRALSKLAEMNPGKKILVVYGWTRENAIIRYAEREREASMRSAIYRPILGNVAPAKLRGFEADYSGFAGTYQVPKWKQVLDENI
jgi:hypothetical protein